jgi:aspartyl-tRNA(Asn)/glutamyl-tRNA(Gln) amidotransferase subunit C
MSSALDEGTVRHIAHLARLTMSDEEISLFAGQLSSILDYMAQLNELDTTGIAPTAHPLPLSNVFRDDEVCPSLDPDQALHNAPERHEGFFRVPRVLDQDSA